MIPRDPCFDLDFFTNQQLLDELVSRTTFAGIVVWFPKFKGQAIVDIPEILASRVTDVPSTLDWARKRVLGEL